MAQLTSFQHEHPERYDPRDSRSAQVGRRIGDAWRAASIARRGQAIAGITIGGAVTAAVAAAGAAPLASVIALGVVGTLAGAAALVDVHEHRIPNALLLVSLAVVLLAVLAAAGTDGTRTTMGVLGDVLIGMSIAALPLFTVRYGKGLAIGDVKFAAVLGAAGGLLHPFLGLVVVWFAALSSGVYALVRHRHRLALGPWLWAGYVSACAVGVLVVTWGGQSWPVQR